MMLRAAAGGNARYAAMASLLLVSSANRRAGRADFGRRQPGGPARDRLRPTGKLRHRSAQQDFQVYENGVLQQIKLFKHEDVPVTAGLVVDHSGSMKPKLAEVSAAARTFVQASNPEDEMFVVNFNEHVELGLPHTIVSPAIPASWNRRSHALPQRA